MNTQKLYRILVAAFCIFVVFLVSRLKFAKPALPEQAITAPALQNPSLDIRPTPISDPVREVISTAAIPPIKETRPHPKSVDTPKTEAPDPDEEFMKRLAAVPLELANLSVYVEVECRIKASEKERAKLIFKETKNGKHTIAYAVKQPSMQEISKVLKPYQMFLDRQRNPASRQYVDQRFQDLVRSYSMTDGKYRLLYTSIPDGPGGGSVMQYSYAASSEQECMDILQQELAPKPPRVIGVTYQDRDGQSSLSRAVMRNRWRMDHLVSEDLLRPFYDTDSDGFFGLVRPAATP